MTRKTLPGSNLMMTIGVALSILGVIVLLSPIAAGDMVVRLVAVVLVLTGVVQLLHALRTAATAHRAASLALGAIVAGVGLLVWLNSEIGSAFLTALLMIFFAVDGVWKVSHAARLRHLRHWGWLLLSGLVSLVFVYLLWAQWPLSGAWAIGVLVGLDLLFGGFALILVAWSIRKARRAEYLDTIRL